jgi:hypothetical protein
MRDEAIFEGATLRDRFVAAVARDDETVAQRLAPFEDSPEDLGSQRDEAWKLLTAGVHWAALALRSAGVEGTDAGRIGDSEQAFQRGQHLDAQLWKLSQLPGFHDGVALLVDAVKRACYHAAELGPIPGGRLGSFRTMHGEPNLTETVGIRPDDLRAIGSDLGEALRWYGELGLGRPVDAAVGVLRTAEHERTEVNAEVDDQSEGARLIALNMALNGAPREETAKYLSDNFSLPDASRLVQELYPERTET